MDDIKAKKKAYKAAWDRKNKEHNRAYKARYREKLRGQKLRELLKNEG